MQENVQSSTWIQDAMLSGLPKKGINVVLFFVSTIFALVLKVKYFRKEFWHDEAFQVLFSKMPVSVILDSNDVHPPLFTLMTKLFIYFTDDIFILRFIIAMISVMFALYFYHTVKQWFGEDAGVFAYMLLCFSTTFAFYSVEFRAYMFVLFLTVIQVRHFSRMLQGRKYSETIYIITSALMVYSHYMAGMIVGLQIVHLILYKKLKKFLISYVHLFALTTPLLIYFVKTLPKVQSFWFDPVTFKSLISTFAYITTLPSTPDFYFYAILVIVFSVGIFFKVEKLGYDENIVLCLMYIVYPILIMFLLNYIGLISMYHHRYFLFGGVFIFALAGYSTNVFKEFMNIVKPVLLVILVLGVLFNPINETSPVYDSAQLINESGKLNIVHSSQFSQSPWKVHLPQHNHYLMTDVNRSQRFTAGGVVIMDWEVIDTMPEPPFYFVSDIKTLGGEIIYDKEGLIVKKFS